MSELQWSESLDDGDNSVWEAPSVVVPGEGEAPFLWRLRQRLFENQIEWYFEGEEELGDSLDRESWRKLDAAMVACQEANENFVQEMQIAQDESEAIDESDEEHGPL